MVVCLSYVVVFIGGHGAFDGTTGATVSVALVMSLCVSGWSVPCVLGTYRPGASPSGPLPGLYLSCVLSVAPTWLLTQTHLAVDTFQCWSDLRKQQLQDCYPTAALIDVGARVG